MKKLLLILSLALSISGNAQCWSKINAGGSHTLAIKTDGTLWAWGSNHSGQLGNGNALGSMLIPAAISCPTSIIGIQENALENAFTVYPNPTNSSLTITTSVNHSSIQIVNTLGQVVFTKEKSTSLNLTLLPSGIYFIQLVDNKGRVIGNEKFVKE